MQAGARIYLTLCMQVAIRRRVHPRYIPAKLAAADPAASRGDALLCLVHEILLPGWKRVAGQWPCLAGHEALTMVQSAAASRLRGGPCGRAATGEKFSAP